jgi:hypothetical protein
VLHTFKVHTRLGRLDSLLALHSTQGFLHGLQATRPVKDGQVLVMRVAQVLAAPPVKGIFVEGRVDGLAKNRGGLGAVVAKQGQDSGQGQTRGRGSLQRRINGALAPNHPLLLRHQFALPVQKRHHGHGARPNSWCASTAA